MKGNDKYKQQGTIFYVIVRKMKFFRLLFIHLS